MSSSQLFGFGPQLRTNTSCSSAGKQTKPKNIWGGTQKDRSLLISRSQDFSGGTGDLLSACQHHRSSKTPLSQQFQQHPRYQRRGREAKAQRGSEYLGKWAVSYWRLQTSAFPKDHWNSLNKVKWQLAWLCFIFKFHLERTKVGFVGKSGSFHMVWLKNPQTSRYANLFQVWEERFKESCSQQSDQVLSSMRDGRVKTRALWQPG